MVRCCAVFHQQECSIARTAVDFERCRMSPLRSSPGYGSRPGPPRRRHRRGRDPHRSTASCGPETASRRGTDSAFADGQLCQDHFRQPDGKTPEENKLCKSQDGEPSCCCLQTGSSTVKISHLTVDLMVSAVHLKHRYGRRRGGVQHRLLSMRRRVVYPQACAHKTCSPSAGPSAGLNNIPSAA